MHNWLTPTIFVSVMFLFVWLFNFAVVTSLAMPAAESAMSEEHESLDFPGRKPMHHLHPVLLSYRGQPGGGSTSCGATVKVAISPTLFDMAVKAEGQLFARQDLVAKAHRRVPIWLMNCSKLL
jgi:hypothetical protein